MVRSVVLGTMNGSRQALKYFEVDSPNFRMSYLDVSISFRGQSEMGPLCGVVVDGAVDKQDSLVGRINIKISDTLRLDQVLSLLAYSPSCLLQQHYNNFKLNFEASRECRQFSEQDIHCHKSYDIKSCLLFIMMQSIKTFGEVTNSKPLFLLVHHRVYIRTFSLVLHKMPHIQTLSDPPDINSILCCDQTRCPPSQKVCTGFRSFNPELVREVEENIMRVSDNGVLTNRKMLVTCTTRNPD